MTGSNSLGFKNAMTIEIWIEPMENSIPGVIYGSTVLRQHNRSFELTLVGGKLNFQISPDGKREMSFVDPRALQELKWHQVVVTFDRGTMKVYVDGRLDKSARNNSVTSIFNPRGDQKRVIGWNFIGSMDELAVYTRALSAQEIASHYRQGTVGMYKVMPQEPIYNGQDQKDMDPTFFSGVFPKAPPVEMKPGEHFEIYDGPLPADRSSSFWAFSERNTTKGWTKYISEKTVYDALLRDIGPDGQKRWELGIGKAGQIYSLRGPWGEAIPPQAMPWDDEVWQATGFVGKPDGVGRMTEKLNRLSSGPIGNGFYQAGANSYQYPPASYQFYAPMLARWFDAKDNAYYILNWMNCPGAPTLFKHKVLVFARYKYLGDGVLEVTSAPFNAGPPGYSYGRHGDPWGGVRNSTYPYVFISKRDGSYEFEPAGGKGLHLGPNNSDGWLGAAASPNDPNAQTFAFVFGKKTSKKDRQQTSGYVAGSIHDPRKFNKRDYIVMAAASINP